MKRLIFFIVMTLSGSTVAQSYVETARTDILQEQNGQFQVSLPILDLTTHQPVASIPLQFQQNADLLEIQFPQLSEMLAHQTPNFIEKSLPSTTCQTSITQSNPNVKGFWLSNLHLTNQTGRQSPLAMVNQNTGTAIGWLLVDQPTTIEGTANCPNMTFKYQLSLTTGWNRFAVIADSGIISLQSVTTNPDALWTLY